MTSAKIIFTSREQFSQLADFMCDNPVLAGSNSLEIYGNIKRQKIWIEFAGKLNSLGGAPKTAMQWQVSAHVPLFLANRNMESNNCSNIFKQDEEKLQDSSQQLPITVKSEKDD